MLIKCILNTIVLFVYVSNNNYDTHRSIGFLFEMLFICFIIYRHIGIHNILLNKHSLLSIYILFISKNYYVYKYNLFNKLLL